MRLPLLAARVLGALALLAGAVRAEAQTLTLRANAGTAGTVPTPFQANYESATKESGSTPSSWTLTVDCPTGNVVKNGENCGISVALTSAGATALGSIKLTYTLSNCRSGGGTTPTTVTIASASPTQIFTASRNSNGCQATITFLVNDLSYTKYPSASSATASRYTQLVAFTVGVI